MNIFEPGDFTIELEKMKVIKCRQKQKQFKKLEPTGNIRLTYCRPASEEFLRIAFVSTLTLYLSVT